MGEPTTYDALDEIEWQKMQRVWDLLEEGELESARTALGDLSLKRPGHPDVRIVEAALALEEGDAEAALGVLDGAERSADPAFFFHLRASARYELARFAEALADAGRSLAVRPDSADTHGLASRIHEHLGDAESARRHAESANELDPGAHPMPLEVGDEEFDAIVRRSLAELPAPVRAKLEELPVVVEPLPTLATLTASDPPLTPDLLGLFVGPHLMERSYSAVPNAPGSIHLYRRNLLRMCADRAELEREVRITVLHEVGHLLGLDEDDLEQWGLA
jgi:predicted Zn-dependent protease with MMP-like domain